MSRAPLTGFVLSLVLWSLPAPAQQRQANGRQAVEDALPASTYACVSFGGLQAGAAAVDQLHVARLVQAFLAQVPSATYDLHIGARFDAAAAELRRQLAQLGIAPATLRAVLARPMVLGLGRMTVRGMGPSMALVIDEGGAGGEIDQLVEQLTGLLRGMDAGFQTGTHQVDALELRTIEHPQGPTMLLARDHGLFVVTNSKGYLREILATRAGAQPSLAKGSALGGQRQRLPSAPIASGYLHTGRLLSFLDAHLPYEAAEIGDALGVRGLDGVYAACCPVEGGMLETIDIGLQGPATGLIKALHRGPADLGAAELCGDDAVLFGSVRCDVTGFVAAFERLVQALPEQASAQVRRRVERSVAHQLRRSGVSAEHLQELATAFSGSVSFAVNLGQGPVPMPELVLFAKVNDPQVVQPWLDRLLAQSAEHAGIEWKTRKAGESVIHFCNLATEMAALTPSFVLADGYLIVSSNTLGLVKVLKQREDAEHSLAVAPDFAAAAQECADAGAFVHLRAFKAVELGWRPFETWALPQIDAHAELLGFGREAIPDQEEFAKALGTTTWSVTVDEAGFRLRTRGPLGPGGLLAAGTRILDDLLLRASGKTN